jgi:NADH dehydrogenase
MDAVPSAQARDEVRMALPKVVIIGAGFGGLEAAKALAKAPVSVMVVDRKNHHCFQPLLYQVATAALSPADIAWPVRTLLRDQKNAYVVMATVSGIDRENRLVLTDIGPLPFDFLIVATGATHSYFGHDEWEPFAPGLKTLGDATNIRARILRAFERAEIAEDEDSRRKLMTFVIIGGGPTGVEMAGAIAEIAKKTLRSDFRHISSEESRVLLLEAGPRLLPAFPERLARYAERSLTRMGVEVSTSNAVCGCDGHGVTTANEHIDAGVTASPAATWLGTSQDRNGRVLVAPDLTVPDMPEVFVIGDTASVPTGPSGPVPGVAPAAKQMGKFAAAVIAARIEGRKPPARFSYRHYGELATIGRTSAIVSLRGFSLTGIPGWLFWSVAHIYYLIGARNRLVVAFDWLWNYLTFQRGARLISP